MTNHLEDAYGQLAIEFCLVISACSAGGCRSEGLRLLEARRWLKAKSANHFRTLPNAHFGHPQKLIWSYAFSILQMISGISDSRTK